MLKNYDDCPKVMIPARVMIAFLNHDYDDFEDNNEGFDFEDNDDNDGFVGNDEEDDFEDNDDADDFEDVNFLQKFPPWDSTCVSKVLTFLLLS